MKLTLEEFKADFDAKIAAMTDEDWNNVFNPPPREPEPCPYCKSEDREFCGPCAHCGKPAHLQGILFCSYVICDECAKAEMKKINEEQFAYLDDEEYQ